MTMSRRPLIAIPARFSDSASALRYRAEVTARALAEAVFDGGGEPLVVHPHGPASDDEVAARLAFAAAVLLPGGGDLDPRWSGQLPDAGQYDVDAGQDAFDLAVARVALRHGWPLLAICRGLQVVNVALGGDLVQDMAVSGEDHRPRRHEVTVSAGSLLAAAAGGPVLPVSCYHHQCLGRLAEGLSVVARAGDGVVEAVEMPGHPGWFLGLQWHPEDLAAEDAGSGGIFRAFATAAAGQWRPYD
ncbi:MAG TPA: gamma-glutamyl-gamma-aminobutyrate hydrolase family protein [Trebonia sp.]|nr:gamma-glutamyl-gamma-aminobutyrate hydrolase family protein [Trebonia sp.]